MADADMSDYYAMSTLSPIANYGKSLQKQRATALALENRLPMNLGSGVLYDPNSRESSVSKEYQQQLESKRQHEMDLANAKMLRKEGRDKLKLAEQRTYDEGKAKLKREQVLSDREFKAEQKKKPSTKTRNDLAGLQASINEGNEMLTNLEENPDTIERWWDIPASAARSFGLDTVGNLIESSLKSPEELSTKQRLNTFVAKVRHSLSGAALTQMEKSLGEAYLPNATGISQAESAERLRNMVKYLESQHNLTSENYDMSGGTSGETDVQRQIRELKEELGQ